MPVELLFNTLGSQSGLRIPDSDLEDVPVQGDHELTVRGMPRPFCPSSAQEVRHQAGLPPGPEPERRLQLQHGELSEGAAFGRCVCTDKTSLDMDD
jgi:hypothetical protein